MKARCASGVVAVKGWQTVWRQEEEQRRDLVLEVLVQIVALVRLLRRVDLVLDDEGVKFWPHTTRSASLPFRQYENTTLLTATGADTGSPVQCRTRRLTSPHPRPWRAVGFKSHSSMRE